MMRGTHGVIASGYAVSGVTYDTFNSADKGANMVLSNGDMTVTMTFNASYAWQGVRVTTGKASGKYYLEFSADTVGDNGGGYDVMLGIASSSAPVANGSGNWLGSVATGWVYTEKGDKGNNNTLTAYGNTFTSSDIIGMAVDLDNGKVWWSKNGAWQNSGDPAAGTGEAFSGLSGTLYPGLSFFKGTHSVTIVTDPADMTYSAPSGFTAGWAV